ncbi:hypothetical protein LBMAG42_56570 [Deltaproteobacteria bacterium]|nr:hypothetical protein LBMAG42_56570 [Deltaproteobacteria bacterium]
MSHSFVWRLTLEADAAFTAVNATADADTLDTVPGATLLGAAAAVDYPADHLAAWRRYHSGAVRFGCGLPLVGNEVTVPAPRCLYRRKDGADAALHNAAAAAPVSQPSPLKEGFLRPNLEVHTIVRRTSVRTAIDRASGRAKESQLHGLELVPAGTTFAGRVSADDPAELAAVRQALAGGVVHLGRSRGAELGRARLEIVEGVRWFAHGPPVEGRATFLCLSDLAVRGVDGGPGGMPASDAVGLPTGWAFDAERSSIRSRSYAPFNGHRRRPDLQRNVIRAGSVLVYRGAGIPDAVTVGRALERGVGELRSEGLGDLWFNPPFLAGAVAKQWKAPCLPAPAPRAVTEPPALAAWLTAQAEIAGQRDERHQRAKHEAEHPAYRRVSSSQWGELQLLAARWPDGGRLQAEVERITSEGARRERWQYAKGPLLSYLKEAGPDAATGLALLASLAPRVASREKK